MQLVETGFGKLFTVIEANIMASFTIVVVIVLVRRNYKGIMMVTRMSTRNVSWWFQVDPMVLGTVDTVRKYSSQKIEIPSLFSEFYSGRVFKYMK